MTHDFVPWFIMTHNSVLWSNIIHNLVPVEKRHLLFATLSRSPLVSFGVFMEALSEMRYARELCLKSMAPLWHQGTIAPGAPKKNNSLGGKMPQSKS